MTNEILEDNWQVVLPSPWSIYTYLYSQGFEKWNRYPWQHSQLLQPREEQSSLSPEDSVKVPHSSWGNSDRQFSNCLSLNRLTDQAVKSATDDKHRPLWTDAGSAGPNPSPGGRWQAKEPIHDEDCLWVLALGFAKLEVTLWSEQALQGFWNHY